MLDVSIRNQFTKLKKVSLTDCYCLHRALGETVKLRMIKSYESHCRLAENCEDSTRLFGNMVAFFAFTSFNTYWLCLTEGYFVGVASTL